MSSPPSLRDTYIPPHNDWSFVPSSQSNSTSPEISSSPSSSSYQWSTRPAPPPIFGLSSSLQDGSGLDGSGLDISSLIPAFLGTVLIEYATCAVAVPILVGQTLLQVQWVPRNACDALVDEVLIVDQNEEDETSDIDNENENDSYFAEPHGSYENNSTSPSPRLVDERGYIVRESLLEDGTVLEYVIPVGSAAGTWGMMKRLGRFQPEGWLSLWKGLLTTTVKEILENALQPAVHALLKSLIIPTFFATGSPSFRSPSSMLIPLLSRVVTGFILSPLDLVSTRLMVQSSVPRYRTYSGPIDALKQIMQHEGGLRGIYFHPQLFLPTILDHTLRSLIPFAVPILIGNYLQISTETHPFMWSCTELVGSCVGLLIAQPLDTIRKRLQVQVRGTAKPLKTCVELRPAPYNGIVDCFWHILTEERSDLPLKPRRHRRKTITAQSEGHGQRGQTPEERVDSDEGGSWLKNTGVGQLYRGLGVRFGTSMIVFVLTLLGAKDDSDAGWAEL